MKSEKWLKFYMESTVRENIRMKNHLDHLISIEEQDDAAKEAIKMFQDGIEHNQRQIAFITWVLGDDDFSEITQDQKNGSVLDAIFKNMGEFMDSFDSTIATKYYFRISDKGPDSLLEQIKILSSAYCDEYGVDYSAGDSVLEIIRYKSELRDTPLVTITAEKSDEVENEQSR